MFNRRFIAVLLALTGLGVLAGFIWLTFNASPALNPGALAGVALGPPGAAARVPGHFLSCADGGPASLLAACTLPLPEGSLRVEVEYTAPDRASFARCEAFFGGRQAPCAETRSVVFGRPLAGVDPAALGIAAAVTTQLKNQYPGSGFQESDWSWLAMGVALIAAVLWGPAAALAGARPGTRQFLVVAVGVGLAAFLLVQQGLLFSMSGLWLID